MVEKDLTVLVIDDEDLILTLVGSFLRKTRYLPLPATDFMQGRRICLDSEGAIDIVLADVSLPPQGKDAFWSLLAERFPRARVIHMSGFTEDQIEVSDWKGLRYFLQKPFKGSDLVSLLDSASQVLRLAGGC